MQMTQYRCDKQYIIIVGRLCQIRKRRNGGKSDMWTPDVRGENRESDRLNGIRID